MVSHLSSFSLQYKAYFNWLNEQGSAMNTGSKISWQMIPLEHRLHLRQRFRDPDRKNRVEAIVIFQNVNEKQDAKGFQNM